MRAWHGAAWDRLIANQWRNKDLAWYGTAYHSTRHIVVCLIAVQLLQYCMVQCSAVQCARNVLALGAISGQRSDIGTKLSQTRVLKVQLVRCHA